MPELCRFGGMVIVMLFHLQSNITSRMFMCTMVNMRLPLDWTVNYWRVLYLVNNIKYWLDGCFIMKKQFTKLGI